MMIDSVKDEEVVSSTQQQNGASFYFISLQGSMVGENPL
jgi:hypothetical protein